MKTYKLWIEIEEYDDETEEHTQPSQDGRAEPVPLCRGKYLDLESAVEDAESLEYHFQPIYGMMEG